MSLIASVCIITNYVRRRSGMLMFRTLIGNLPLYQD